MSLTDEDKQWFREQFDLFATKPELERFATRVQLELLAIKEQLGRFATREELERVETSLLTEFHKWASPLEARQRTHAAALRAMDLELEALSDRVQKLESPPPSDSQ